MRIPASARSRVVFAVGITLIVLAWVYWILRVAPSYWSAHRESDERVSEIIFYTGVAACMIAPFLSSAPLRQRILRSVLAGATAIFVTWVLGFVLFFGFIGF